MLLNGKLVTSRNCLGVLDEPSLEHVQRGVRDPVGAETFVQDADLFDVLRFVEPGGDRDGDAVGDGACLHAPAARAVCGRGRIAKAELEWLWEGQQAVRGFRGQR